MNQQSQNGGFFAGLEEVFARILSLILSIVFFIIFIAARGDVSVNVQSSVVSLIIFWIIYEALALVLYYSFTFFSSQKNATTEQIVRESAEKPKEAIDTENSEQQK